MDSLQVMRTQIKQLKLKNIAKEIIKYLDGEYTLDEAIDIIKRDSRRYAKRQLTWFRRYDDAKWFNLDEYSDSQVLKNDIIMHIEKML